MKKILKFVFSLALFLGTILFIFYRIDCHLGDIEKETISYEDYLYLDKKPWHILRINSNGNVAFKGKVVLSETDGLPLNNNNANTYSEIKTFILAKHIKPKKGCNPNKPENGIYGLGCYTNNH